MESMKNKLGIVLLVLCLIGVAAVVWYLIATSPDGKSMEGTLVQCLPGWRLMRL
jgi:uncharacterized membrane protein YozB (DUF420 family)